MIKPIRYVYHTADLHIPSRTSIAYRDEFTTVAATFMASITTPSNQNAVVICGDLFDSVPSVDFQLMPHIIDWFKAMAAIMPVIVIAGNHDYERGISVDGRLARNAVSSLSSICGINNPPDHSIGFYHMARTGCMHIRGIDWYALSRLDEGPIPPLRAVQGAYPYVALYHDSLHTATTDVGHIIRRGDNLSDFIDFDVVMAGDIHKTQSIGRVFYPGSLYQQNIGETLQRGYLLWDFGGGVATARTIQPTFVRVPNKYGSVMIDLRTTPHYYGDGGIATPPIISIAKIVEIRIVGDITPTIRAIIDAYGAKYNVAPVVAITAVSLPVLGGRPIEALQHADSWIELLREGGASPAVLAHHTEFAAATVLGTLVGTPWRLLRLEWSNFMCYDADNCIDFTSIEGVTGVIAGNFHGKSAIVDVLLYALYGRDGRGNVADAIRQGTNCMRVSAQLQTHDAVFTIERIRNRDDIKKPILCIMRRPLDGGAPPTQVGEHELELAVGPRRRLIETVIMQQHDHEGILACSNPEMRQRLVAFMRLDCLKNIETQVRAAITACKTAIAAINGVISGISAGGAGQLLIVNQDALAMATMTVAAAVAVAAISSAASDASAVPGRYAHWANMSMPIMAPDDANIVATSTAILVGAGFVGPTMGDYSSELSTRIGALTANSASIINYRSTCDGFKFDAQCASCDHNVHKLRGAPPAPCGDLHAERLALRAAAIAIDAWRAHVAAIANTAAATEWIPAATAAAAARLARDIDAAAVVTAQSVLTRETAAYAAAAASNRIHTMATARLVAANTERDVLMARHASLNAYLSLIDNKSGIPRQLLSAGCGTIAALMNTCLARFTNFTVSFCDDGVGLLLYIHGGQPQAPTTGGQPQAPTKCVYNSASGCQRFLVTLAMRIALIQLCRDTLPSFLFIDEGFTAMDDTHLLQARDVLRNIHDVGFVFIISHLRELQGAINNALTIKHTNGVSHCSNCDELTAALAPVAASDAAPVAASDAAPVAASDAAPVAASDAAPVAAPVVPMHTCECGITVRRSGLTLHTRSQKHIKVMAAMAALKIE